MSKTKQVSYEIDYQSVGNGQMIIKFNTLEQEPISINSRDFDKFDCSLVKLTREVIG